MSCPAAHIASKGLEAMMVIDCWLIANINA